MSSFQFPANPSDGDIVVRGNLQAFYNAATNTWRVSEVPTAPGIPGPPGPPGPEGPPGKGVSISGSVDTFANLPEPNTAQFNFWIVNDTNTLYYSDGIDWIDFGGPIQGPPGEPGEDGSEGTNGQNGRGWYDTNIIDERPNNYQVQFLSNDGLGFTTDNIMGPQGEVGSLQVATEDTLGGIKIGRGLNILPDGTLQAGETFVTLETVPLGTDGRPDLPVPTSVFFSIDYEPQFGFWSDNLSGAADGSAGSGRPWTVSNTSTFTMPEGADGAIVYYFSSAGTTPNASPASVVPGWFYGETKLEVSGATFADGGRLNVPHAVNFATKAGNPGGNGATPSTKIGLIRFARGGASVTFTASARVTTARKAAYTLGRGRIAIVPYKSGSGDDANPLTMDAFVSSFADNLAPGTDFEGFPDVSDEENLQFEASDLKLQILQLQTEIDTLTVQEYPEGTAAYTQLMGLRQELIDLRNLPGGPDDIGAEVMRIDTEVSNLADYQFRFE